MTAPPQPYDPLRLCVYATIAVLTPTTCPRELTSGPPELPGLIGAEC